LFIRDTSAFDGATTAHCEKYTNYGTVITTANYKKTNFSFTEIFYETKIQSGQKC